MCGVIAVPAIELGFGAGETDDLIVPYQEGSENCLSKKEWIKETAAIKPTEQKSPGDKVDLHRRKLEGGSDLNANGGIANSIYSMDLWPELSLSSTEKSNHDSMAREVSDNLVGITECSSKNGKEQGDFVDYSWAKIGSFDDLDRILSNDYPIFGSLNLGNADELWSSSKEATNCPEKSFPTIVDSPSLALGVLKSTSENLEVKREYNQKDTLSITLSYGKLDGSTSHGLHNVEFPGDRNKSVCEETNAETGGKTSPLKSHLPAEKDLPPIDLADKEYRQNKLLKFKIKQKTRNLATSVVKSSPSLVVSHQRQLQGSDSLQYQHINTFVAPSTYGNLTNQYPTIPILSNIQSREISHQPLLPCYDVSHIKSNPANRSAPTSKSSRMTPQEKIEKLRWRQQMRALLAIKNQQQQFTHQVPNLSPLASFDPNSPFEKNYSNTVAVAIDDHSVEDRRHYASETSRTSIIIKDENESSKEEDKNHNRMSETETETNPIDRTVAHLLFHRPPVLSRKHPETPESLASIKLPCERKTVSKVPSPLLDRKHVEQFKNSPFVDAS
ncbi:Agglutinin-like protein ALA1, putative isoform 1 [Hibiscus syriacus]|uniref:Agglutinin-like protein ALA1, putative isoform 1 n=1 Tax=Hibiscus syriacus TaxID=106335 RepID=A0A6A2X282_HIBSY|nr:Agglutinin-like protein ALA1, putative isoform 1 [Hibiscus syriacus]